MHASKKQAKNSVSRSLLCAAITPVLLCGCGNEESREVEGRENSLLIPAELAFRFAAGLHPDRHRRSFPANQRGTQALMRAKAQTRCGRIHERDGEGVKQESQWQWGVGVRGGGRLD